ncbi:hypothetical protein [Sulfoacidibacillus thermotolerans]|nr:hypothetical protein [Sulfoacidibacillus thermotolerans]
MDLFAKESNELDALREMNQESKVTVLNTREASTAENVTSKAEVVGGASVGGTGETETVTSNQGRTYDVTRSGNHTSTTSVPHPAKGQPNSSVDILDKQTGGIKMRRWFGPDGRAIRDVDFTNHGNPSMHPEWPHEHIFEWFEDGSFNRIP